MARFLLNSDNFNSDNSFVIEGIKIASIAGNPGGEDTPLSSILSQGDINGDGNNDLFVQSSLLFSETGVTQENFVVLGSSSLPERIDITQLNGSNGFTFGETTSFISGFDDLNQNNFDDLIFSTIGAGENNNQAIVLLGNDEFPATVNIDAVDGNDGFKVTDSNSNTLAAVSLTGDVNNDGIKDLAFIGSRPTENSVESVSKIVFGLENYPAELDISDLDGTNGFTVNDTGIISGIGFDVNQDEFDDLFFTSNSNPISYLLFGRSQFTPEVDLNNLAEGEGFSIIEEGSNQSDRFFGGFSEDINGDGIGDIALLKTIELENAEGQTTTQSNKIFIIYGGNQSDSNTLDLATLNGNNGFTIDFPAELQSIVDINGDNRQDLFIQNLADNKTYVIFGSDSLPATFSLDSLNSLDGTNGFVIENLNIEPLAVADFGAVGDINGDNVDDLAFDTEGDSDYILLGSQEAFPASIDLTSTDANAIEVTGNKTANGIAGFSDINGDGADDIIFSPVTDEEDDTVANSSIVFGDSELSFATNNSGENPEPEPEPNPNPEPEPTPNPEEDQTIELFRFRNTSFETGTYVFVGDVERDAILADENLSQTFALDGQQEDGTINPAFKASLVEGENLIPFYRLKSLDVPGTFLFVSDGEYNAIFADDSEQKDKWETEGLDENGNDIAEFYLLDGSANQGIEFNRFQNNQNNTFLYAGADETNAIESDPNLSNLFTNQGVAFESLT